MFNNTFFHFLFGFAAILGVAFAVLIITGMQVEPDPIDNIAVPQ